MSQPAQSFENHAKFVPLYHYVANALVLFPTLYFGYRAVTSLSLETIALFLFGVGVVLVTVFARFFPLGVQDRVIRLEEQLRLERLLPGELRPRIAELQTSQLIGLRFASDGELTELVGRVLEGGLREQKEIKQAVKAWRADHQRI